MSKTGANVRGTTIVTVVTGLTLLLTLTNQIVLAYLFGAGISMDAFLACGAVPFVVLNLAIGDLGYVLIPLLLRYEATGDVARVMSKTFTAVLAISVAITLLGIAAHRPVLRLTTASNMPRASFNLAVSMAPMMWVIIGFTILGSYLTGLHHYYRQFAAAAWTLMLPYLGMISGGLLGARYWGIHAVVFGWLLGTFSRSTILYCMLPRPRPGLRMGMFHEATGAMFRALGPLGISLLPFTAVPMIDVYWASRLPVGSISYLGYSTRISIAITSIVVQGLSVVLFPELSEDAQQGRLDQLGEKMRGALTIIFALIVPLAALAFLLRGPMLTILLERGRFTAAASLGVERVLPFYLLSMIWIAMMNIVSRTFFALRDYATTAWTGLAALALYIALSGLLIRHFSYLGIGISYAIFWTTLFLLQTWRLGRKLGPVLNEELVSFFAKVLASAAIALAACTVWGAFGGLHGAVLSVTVTALLFLASYTVMSVGVFRITQYTELLRVIFDRGRALIAN